MSKLVTVAADAKIRDAFVKIARHTQKVFDLGRPLHATRFVIKHELFFPGFVLLHDCI